MGQHHRTNAEPTRQQLQRRADVAARIGKGDQFSVADFRALQYAERLQLKRVNPDAYEALAAGREPGGAWRPTTHGRSNRAQRLAEVAQ